MRECLGVCVLAGVKNTNSRIFIQEWKNVLDRFFFPSRDHDLFRITFFGSLLPF
jgi:hypothetical protein